MLQIEAKRVFGEGVRCLSQIGSFPGPRDDKKRSAFDVGTSRATAASHVFSRRAGEKWMCHFLDLEPQRFLLVSL